MTVGVFRTTSRLAIAAAAGLFMGGIANAGGSIGGDCCADLEERVAELEATTVRKGNRKVSLEISGHVNKAILVQDFNQDTADWADFITGVPGTLTPRNGELQIIDNPLSGSRFRLKGSAKISSDLYAGYLIEFGVTHDVASPLSLRKNELYIGSNTFGRLTIGHGSMSTDGIAEIDLSGTTVAGGSLNISGLANFDGGREERVRYDSPTLAGFRLSASWEENEDFDVALRYGATLGDFTIAAGIGYAESTETLDVLGVVFPLAYTWGASTETVSGSISALHVPTGLNLTFAAGEKEYDFGGFGTTTSDYWYLKGGVKRKIFAAGASALSVDYHTETTFAPNVGAIQFGHEFGGQATREKIGVQFVQSVDAAAMDLYASFWSVSSDITFAGQDALEEDGFMAGARIRF